MSANTPPKVLRPAGGLKAAIMSWVMEILPFGLQILRAFRPILHFGNTFVVTRYDDVREVFLNDWAFRVPYAEKLDVIMGHHPFFLSMDDTPDYHRDTEAMRKVVRANDIPGRLIPAVEQLGEMIVAEAKGQLEVVELAGAADYI